MQVLADFGMVPGRGARSWERLSGPHQPGGKGVGRVCASGAPRDDCPTIKGDGGAARR
jgi:hypothetical protein